MKKTLIALAAVAAATAASAQVTLGGMASVSVNKLPGEKATIARGDAALYISATEDLGGGVKVKTSFDLLANPRTENNSAFSENFDFTVSGGFGTVSVGQNNSSNQRLSGGESLANYLHEAWSGDATRTTYKYTLPTLVQGLSIAVAGDTGVTGKIGTAAAAPLDSIGNEDSAASFIFGYTQGPWSVGFERRVSDDRNTFKGSYDFGFAKVAVAGDDAAKDRMEFAVTAPVSAALTVGLHMGDKNQDANGYAVSANYALSKRTSVVASFGEIKDDVADAGANNGSENDLSGRYTRVKLVHTF